MNIAFYPFRNAIILPINQGRANLGRFKTFKVPGIFIDREEEGCLLQIFTKFLLDRPSLLFDIIRRKGAKSSVKVILRLSLML